MPLLRFKMSYLGHFVLIHLWDVYGNLMYPPLRVKISEYPFGTL